MTKLGLRNSITLYVIGAYLVLNWYFMLVRFPPVGGGGVPVGEILLLVWFFLLFIDLRWLPSFTNNIIFVPFLIWWAFGIGKACLAYPEYGMWAFRDATHVIESLFLWVGFVLATAPSAMDHLFVWLRRVLTLGVLYSFTYPWRELISPYTPAITSAAGYTTQIFVFYTTSGVVLIWESVCRVIERHGKSLWIPTLLLTYAIGIFQARTIYLQVIAVLLMLLLHRRKAFGKIGLALGGGLLCIVMIAESGVEIKGRQNENISIEFLVDHFYAIAGVKSKLRGADSAAGGVNTRIVWWTKIYEKLTASTENLVFGLGVGFPLIDFVDSRKAVVREPHNSMVSIVARFGIFGLLCFLWIHVHLVRAWLRAYNLCRKAGYQIGQDRLFLLMVYFVLVWIYSIGEAAFEAPYLAIPYYFFWGVVLQYRLQLKRMLTREEVATEKPYVEIPALHAHPDSP